MTWLVTCLLANAVVVIPLAVGAYALSGILKRPAISHLLWAAILIKLVTPPIINIPIPWQFEAPDWNPAVAIENNSVKSSAPSDPSQEPDAAETPPVSINQSPVTSFPVAATATRPWTSPRWILLSLLALWGAGSVALAVWSLAQASGFYRKVQRLGRPDEFLTLRTRRIARGLGLTSCPTVVLLGGVFSPMLWGAGSRARLIFPADLFARLDRASIDALLLHELAHYTRGDHWVRLLELVAKVLFWWHPVVWWAVHELESAEEQCCDAWVIAHQDSPPRTYAEALLTTIDFLNEETPALPPVASGLGNISLLRRRLTQIMRGEVAATIPPVLRLAIVGGALAIAPIGPALFASSRVIAEKLDLPSPQPLVDSFNELANATTPPNPLSADTTDPENQPLPAESSHAREPWRPTTLVANAVSPNGKFRLEARTGLRTKLIDLSRQLPLDLTADQITCASFAPEDLFATGHREELVRLWNTNGSQKSKFETDAAVTSVAFSSDGRYLAAGTSTGSLFIWEVDSGKSIVTDWDAPNAQLGCVRWSPEGDRLAIAVGPWNDVRQAEFIVWDVHERNAVLRESLDRPCAAFSWLQNDTLVVSDWEGRADVWQVSSRFPYRRLALNKDTVSAAHWSPDCPLVSDVVGDLVAERR